MIKHIKITCILYVLGFALFFSQCKNNPKQNQITDDNWVYQSIHGPTQGTFYNITYKFYKNNFLQDTIDSILNDFDNSLSTYKANSIISHVNKNNPVEVDDFFIEVYNKAIAVNQLSQGAFDITIGPVINAWGFNKEEFDPDSFNIDALNIDSLMQYVGIEKVALKNNKVIKQSPHIKLDVNGIAQGYSVDVIARYFEKKGIKHYLIEIGGEVRARGKNTKGSIWKIGVDKPIDGNITPGNKLQAVIKLNNKSLATSGNYRKYFVKDGIKYSHSIDPATGFPVRSNLLSVTVLAQECMTADAWATALMVMGLERSKEYLKTQDKIDALLVYSDSTGSYQNYITSGLKDVVIE